MTVHPGDTLWVRGGAYKGIFSSHLLGTAAARITVKPYQLEQAVLDSAGTAGTILDIQADGGFTDYIGLEVKASAPQRWGLDDVWISFGNCPASGMGVNVLAPSTRIINFVVHDTSEGIGAWRPATDSELYGNIVYNNGCDAPGRGHGHAIYAQNIGPDWKKITANVVLPHWDAGFHIYGGSAELNNFDIEQNIILGGAHQFGGSTPMQNWIFSRNFAVPEFWRFHYNNQGNSGLTFNDNYVLSCFPAFWWDQITAQRNTFYNPGGGWKFELRSQPSAQISLNFDQNRYIRSAASDYIGDVGNADASAITQYNTFADWQTAGQDAHGSVITAPKTQEILYSPNVWESKRGHMVVVNWTGAATASADLSKLGYANGDAYSIWDVQALGDPQPLHSGTWNGTPVSLDLAYTGLTLPSGDYSPQCWNTEAGGCSTCNPIPAGCYTHPVFKPQKTPTTWRAFLVRNVPGPIQGSTTPLVISSVDGTPTTNAAAINWATNQPADSQVEYGTTTLYGQASLLDSSLVTSHGAALAGLSSATTYHYRVKSRDVAGNLAASSDFSFTTADTAAPVISGVGASSVSSSGATVNWTTNEPADSQVEYGTTTSYGQASLLDSSLVTSHGAALTGLSSGTTYHYRVKSRDAAGNLAVSGDITFTTSDTTAPVISGVGASSVSGSGATINWATNEPADSQVEYGTTTSYGQASLLGSSLVTSHGASLTALASGTTYHYRVKSRDAAGNLAASGDFSFTTADTTAPVISGVGASAVSGSGATINWATNEPADSQVEYGTTTSYGQTTPLDSSLVTSHGASLTGLSSGTRYHYRVKSRDAAANLGVSGDFTFTTSKSGSTTPTGGTPPVISGVAVSSVGPSNATITWTTNDPADSQVEYGTTTSYGQTTALDSSMVTSHKVRMNNLSKATSYHYRVKSRDQAGNAAVSGDFVFSTTAPGK